MKYFIGIVLFTLLFISQIYAQEFSSSSGLIKVITIAKGLEHPWGFVFLPDDRILVTERPGRLRIISKNGDLSDPIQNLPKVYNEGQGGLLDIALDPNFTQNHFIYFSYAEEIDGKAGTAVAQATLNDRVLENVKVIFRQYPKVIGDNHWGSRLVFAKDGTLFITLGERFDYRDKAQDLSTDLGKIVHINKDGTPASNNPFLHQKNVLPEIWSYGHRNVQGAILNPDTGILWAAEHGPRGGDEINIIEAGKNYGWPQASYGSHYTGVPIPDEHASHGFIEPIYHWTPSISPSGMMFYTGDRFPQWKNNLFLGALSGECLIRLEIKENKIVKEERLLQDLEERIRDIQQGPDGLIYLITDNDDGRILRLEPSN
ncbi:MAG: PQQ-dependent sugar dehydrogenase [Alphaproteobacteria bacterium]|nr:PQQ-dependent sugar dehydrogenase [Alphaproteobacteria bacterium]